MQKVKSAADLKQSIKELEARSKRQEEALKDNLKATGQSIKQTLKPVNLIKTGFNTVRQTPSIQATAVNTLIGLVAGYVTKRLVVGKSVNIFRRTLGAVVQAAIIKVVHNKLPAVQQKAAQLISKKNNLRSSPSQKALVRR